MTQVSAAKATAAEPRARTALRTVGRPMIAVASPAAVAARITATAVRRPETTSTERTPSSAQITLAASCPITPNSTSGVTTKVNSNRQTSSAVRLGSRTRSCQGTGLSAAERMALLSLRREITFEQVHQIQVDLCSEAKHGKVLEPGGIIETTNHGVEGGPQGLFGHL